MSDMNADASVSISARRRPFPPVVILCGGKGTRIRGVSDSLPKPMVPIGGRPIVWHIMKMYEKAGANDFVLCLGHHGWEIKDFFINYRLRVSDVTVKFAGSGSRSPVEFHDAPLETWSVTLAETGEGTQTGGRLWRVRRHLVPDGTFCLTYGDGVADLDITALVEFHRSHGRAATVTGVRPPGRFGDMDLAEGTNLVQSFVEKPQSTSGWINGGFFVLEPRVWGYLDGSPDQVFEQSVLSRLAEDGELAVFKHQTFWQPMDTYREWTLLNEMWEAGSAPWQNW